MREEFIQKTKETFGNDLKWKEDTTMTSFYLYEIKHGNGFFWIYKERNPSGGYTIEIQKVKNICDKINNRAFGDYPCVVLNFEADIPRIISLLKDAQENFHDRYSSDEIKEKDILILGKILKSVKDADWYISERKYDDLLEEVNEVPGCENITKTYLKHLVNLTKKFKITFENE